MKLLDTAVLIGAISPRDRHHQRAIRHLDSLDADPEVFLPTTTVIEFDLELKSHGYTSGEREITFEDLSAKIPPERVLALTPLSLIEAVKIEDQGFSYFDSLIAAQAKVKKGEVITTDRAIRRLVRTSW